MMRPICSEGKVIGYKAGSMSYDGITVSLYVNEYSRCDFVVLSIENLDEPVEILVTREAVILRTSKGMTRYKPRFKLPKYPILADLVLNALASVADHAIPDIDKLKSGLPKNIVDMVIGTRVCRCTDLIPDVDGETIINVDTGSSRLELILVRHGQDRKEPCLTFLAELAIDETPILHPCRRGRLTTSTIKHYALAAIYWHMKGDRLAATLAIARMIADAHLLGYE